MSDNPHLRILREQLERGQLVLFIGADWPQEITGLPSRKDMARELARRWDLDVGRDGISPLPLAEVAQRVGQAGDRFEFTDFICNTLDTIDRLPQLFHQRVVELVKTHPIRTIITTAYDDLLERAFQGASVGVNRVVNNTSLTLARASRPTLIKLYGDVEQPDTLVITEQDHFGLLRDQGRKAVVNEVRQAFRRNTVLFIGYNLADPDFRFLFDQVAESRFARPAYAVWPGLPEADVQMWRDRNVVILSVDSLGILDEIAVQPVPEPPVPSPPPPRPEPEPPVIPPWAWLLLALLLLDACLATGWVWCSLKDQPTLVTYLGTVCTFVSVLVAILPLVFVVDRKIKPEDALHRLGTSKRWRYIVLVLTALSAAITFLFWPLGWVGKCFPTPTPTPSPMLTVIPSTPTLTPAPPLPTLPPTPTTTPTPTPVCRDVQVLYLELDLATGPGQRKDPDATGEIILTRDDIRNLAALSGQAVLTGADSADCTCRWEGKFKVADSFEDISGTGCGFFVEIPDQVAALFLRFTVGGQTMLFTVRVQ
jgi:hypothetical protein